MRYPNALDEVSEKSVAKRILSRNIPILPEDYWQAIWY
jgi:hypothetical protein